MRKAPTLVTIFSVFLFTACGTGTESGEKTSPATQTNTTISNPVTTDANTKPSTQQLNVSANNGQQNANNTVIKPEIKAPEVKSTAGLNPAHGQPGHRCDIAVGAPLDSKPTQPTFTNSGTGQANTKPVVTTTPVVNQPTTTNTNTTTASVPANGLNPAHGQPGHRCDIAVGAPLNSKPTTNAQVLPALTPIKQ